MGYFGVRGRVPAFTPIRRTGAKNDKSRNSWYRSTGLQVQRVIISPCEHTMKQVWAIASHGMYLASGSTGATIHSAKTMILMLKHEQLYSRQAQYPERCFLANSRGHDAANHLDNSYTTYCVNILTAVLVRVEGSLFSALLVRNRPLVIEGHWKSVIQSAWE